MTIKEDGPGAANAPAQGHDDPWRDCADDAQAMQRARAEVVRQEKRLATIKAQAALKGVQVHLTTGTNGNAEFIACRWGYWRVLDDIDALDHFVASLPGSGR